MIRTFGIMIIFFVSFIGAKYLVQYGVNEYSENKVSSAFNDMFLEMEEEANTFPPKIPKSIAIQQVAIKKAEENINSKNTPFKKKQAALATFMGFYLVNSRTRSNFCNNLGVNISTFTNEFKNLHEKEFKLSKKLVFNQSGAIDKIYKILKPQGEKLIKQDMADISKKSDITLTGACLLFKENGSEFAQRMTILKIQPTVYHAIHDKI